MLMLIIRFIQNLKDTATEHVNLYTLELFTHTSANDLNLKAFSVISSFSSAFRQRKLRCR